MEVAGMSGYDPIEALCIRIERLGGWRQLVDDGLATPDLADVVLGYDALTMAIDSLEETVRELRAENRRLREGYRILAEAVDVIASAKECDGPGCFYCDCDIEHPPSGEARMAQKALKEVRAYE